MGIRVIASAAIDHATLRRTLSKHTTGGGSSRNEFRPWRAPPQRSCRSSVYLLVVLRASNGL
eukprot:scaffold102017_cov29-Prasinocladus_malaysianus.AAC.1